MTRKIAPFLSAKGELFPPGDKSVTHRCVLFGAMAEGTFCIQRPLLGADCRSSITCMRDLGVEIKEQEKELLVQGVGLHGLRPPKGELDAGNSGTTMRLLAGILAGQKFSSQLTGDGSLRARPMNRVIQPLRRMGALVQSFNNTGRAPLCFDPAELKGACYASTVASAQVKSAVLLAGLFARNSTTVIEPAPSRDHSERLLKAMGARIKCEGNRISIEPGDKLKALDLSIPGDISSAAFFICLGLLAPDSEIVLRNVGLNPGRTGFIKTVIRMGGRVEIVNQKGEDLEPYGDVVVQSSRLKGIHIHEKDIPSMIDELPLAALCAALAEGETRVTGAEELRCKETDRIQSIASAITSLGGKIQTQKDGFVIQGSSLLKGGTGDSMGDHRIAMMLAVGGAVSQNGAVIHNHEATNISYPNFFEDLEALRSL